MVEQANVRTVQEIYAAFGRGDIPALLGALAEDVEWSVAGPQEVPHAGKRRGRAEVAAFFPVLAETEEFEQFEPREFIAQGDQVVVLGYLRSRVKATGRRYENEWAMVWTLRDGKVTRFRTYEDTAAEAAAYRAA
jgi:ketosteroid isomerase-like protein